MGGSWVFPKRDDGTCVVNKQNLIKKINICILYMYNIIMIRYYFLFFLVFFLVLGGR